MLANLTPVSTCRNPRQIASYPAAGETRRTGGPPNRIRLLKNLILRADLHNIGRNMTQENEMPSLKWRDEYSIGVEQIDHQHKHVFSLVARFKETVSDEAGVDEIGRIVEELMAYTREHFAAEETLQARHHYPGFDEHREMHADLIERVEEFRERVRITDSYVNLDLVSFLRDWLVNHIQEEDRKIGEHISQHV